MIDNEFQDIVDAHFDEMLTTDSKGVVYISSVDWDQRRYEIAKEVAKRHHITSPEEDAKLIAKFSNTLINELKKYEGN